MFGILLIITYLLYVCRTSIIEVHHRHVLDQVDIIVTMTYITHSLMISRISVIIYTATSMYIIILYINNIEELLNLLIE